MKAGLQGLGIEEHSSMDSCRSALYAKSAISPLLSRNLAWGLSATSDTDMAALLPDSCLHGTYVYNA